MMIESPKKAKQKVKPRWAGRPNGWVTQLASYLSEQEAPKEIWRLKKPLKDSPKAKQPENWRTHQRSE